MAKSSFRDKFRSGLKEKVKESHDRRDSGSNFKDFFDADKMSGVKKWWAGKGTHIVDMIPYLAGPNDPHNKEGEPTYVLDIEVHKNVGPLDEQVVCLEQYGDGRVCPICEEARRRNKKPGVNFKKEIKPLKPTRRSVYNVIVRDGGEQEKKGVQVFDIAHFFMEKHLSKIAKSARGDGYTVFSSPDNGKVVVFERTGTGAENTSYSGWKFDDRVDADGNTYEITDDELKAAYCLDDLIKIMTTEEVAEIFYGKGSKPKPSTNEDESGDEGDGEGEQQEQRPVRGAGGNRRQQPPPPDKDEDEGAGDAEGEAEGEGEGEGDPEPPPPPRRELRKPKGDAGAGSSKKGASVCPHGGTIGVSIDELDECEECSLYDECEKIADSN